MYLQVLILQIFVLSLDNDVFYLFIIIYHILQIKILVDNKLERDKFPTDDSQLNNILELGMIKFAIYLYIS